MLTRSWLTLVFLGLAACGTASSGNGDTGNDPAKTDTAPTGGTTGSTTPPAPSTPKSTVSGFILSPSFNGNITDMDHVQVTVLDPNTSPITVLGSIPLDANSAACKAGTCAFSIPNVDLSKVSASIVVYTSDNRDPNKTALEWAPVSTGTTGHAAVAAAVTSGKLENQYAFAVNGNGLAALAKVTKTKTATDLVTNGTYIGLLVGNANDTAQANGTPPFIANATVTGDANVTISYPNDKFDGTGNKTATSGAFIAVPAKAPYTVNFTPKAANNDKTHTWGAQDLTIVPGVLLMTVFVSQ